MYCQVNRDQNGDYYDRDVGHGSDGVDNSSDGVGNDDHGVGCWWRPPWSFLGSRQLAAPGWLPNRGRHLVEKQVCFKISRLEIALQGPMMGRMKITVNVDGNEVFLSFTGSLLP